MDDRLNSRRSNVLLSYKNLSSIDVKDFMSCFSHWSVSLLLGILLGIFSPMGLLVTSLGVFLYEVLFETTVHFIILPAYPIMPRVFLLDYTFSNGFDHCPLVLSSSIISIFVRFSNVGSESYPRGYQEP